MGKTLPPWRLADLPAPPPFSFRNVLAVIGPGTIALSMSIGGGEWLLGPTTIVKYGFSMMWIVTVSILLQLMMNLQFVRYTLYTGEPIVNGFLRTRPGPWFWAAVYLVLALCQGGWPAWAANSASTLFAAYHHRLPGTMPDVDDRQVMLLLGSGTFILCVLVVAFGGKVERMLEIVNWFMVLFIVGFLLIVDLLFVPAEVWWKGLTGHFHLGWLPKTDQGIDWILLGAFAAYAGAGGVSNLWMTNWIRDKGMGMGSLVGYIPSAVGGKVVKVSPTGSAFPPNEENLSRWRLWWRYVHIDQVWIWAVGCFVGMYLNIILAAALIPPGTDIGTGLAPGATQAEYVSQAATTFFRTPFAGHVLWFLTLLNGFWILFGTQLAFVDGMVRLASDVLWTASEKIRALARGDIRRVYYFLLVVYAVWGCFAINLSQPLMLLKISANVAGVVFIVAGLHVLWLNKTLLPKEVQSPFWQRAMVGLGVLFYGFFSVMNLIQLIRG
jgi:hypothetical protein